MSAHRALWLAFALLAVGSFCSSCGDTLAEPGPAPEILEAEVRITVSLEVLAAHAIGTDPAPVDPPLSLNEAKNRQAAALERIAGAAGR